MHHQRLLDALDSSSPLLFMEAVHGSGKRTILRQWEASSDHRHGEIRLRFSARRLPTDPAIMVRMFWSSLRHRLKIELPALPEEDSQIEEFAVRHLGAVRRPIAVAIQDAEQLTEGAFDIVVRLLDSGIRLILAGYDLTELTRMAQRRGHYSSKLGEQEVWLSLNETRALLEERGAGLSEDAVTMLYRATSGHPGMVLTSAATMPAETARSVVTRDRAISAYLAEAPMATRTSGFAKFLEVTVHLPRFTARAASALSDREDAGPYLSRLQALGVGRMAWHPVLQERAFHWNERIRQVIKQTMPLQHAEEQRLRARLLAAAEAGEDEELRISALVLAGRLDEAEARLQEEIWDVLPNAMSPLWEPLERLSPLALVERPALLSARLRLSPHHSRSPVSARAARRAGQLQADATDGGSPWGRVAGLAYAIEFALYAGERERLIDLFVRARSLIADLLDSEAADAAGGRQVSELLLIADTVFRSGNTIPAAEIGRFAAQLIEVDPSRLDPRGDRLTFARRLILHDHRARGLDDELDPAPLLAGTQLLWRDGEIVATTMAMMWIDFDEGDPHAADAHLHAAAARVADPEQWQILMLMRAHLSLHRGATGELEGFVGAYERSTLSRPGEFAQGTLSQMARITDFLSTRAGRALPSPGYLPATPEPGRPFYPRTEFSVHVMEALYAVRADEPATARTALSSAVGVSPRRELGLYVLANATADEVRALREIAESVPGGARLRMDRALQFAGSLHRSPIELSEREREVLERLREGATNKVMAGAMFVSVNTVKFHRANLMRKLGATNRTELLALADRRGL